LATFADDLVLYLLIAGLRVAYGGVLGHDALQKVRSKATISTMVRLAPPREIGEASVRNALRKEGV
jgi:hypothetical protein